MCGKLWIDDVEEDLKAVERQKLEKNGWRQIGMEKSYLEFLESQNPHRVAR